ncbi:hypothetical protein KQ718_17685, partial [Listeria monocytogenes]|nr:hypothetical protein [Listeria monocytogenes]
PWVVSGHLRHWLLDRGVAASKVAVLPWFADVDSWKPDSLTRAKVRARLGIAPQCVVIAYAGGSARRNDRSCLPPALTS